MTCPVADVLVDFASHALDEDGARRVEAHVDTCSPCRRAIASLVAAMAPSPAVSSAASTSALSSTTRPATPATAAKTSRVLRLRAGDRIDHYVVEALLGVGGMALVYLATDPVLRRRAAIKVLRASLALPHEREAFLEEARTTAGFQHPHIVTVYGAGTIDGHPYLALEYVDGETLGGAKDLPWREIVRVARAIVAALGEAHGAGVVHCDLKPNNVLVTNGGRILVADFGLAQRMRRLEGDARVATPAGTPAYMAPEQWSGHRPTAETDIWALGVVLYELLSGRRPFEGATTSALRAAIVGDSGAPALPTGEWPRPLAEIVMRCLARAAAERPTLAELEDVLAATTRAIDPGDATGDGPFRGLLPFTAAHAASFFGREIEIEAAIARLRTEPVLVVLGASGVGKSSFLRAGLLPRLAAERTTVIELYPGRDPFASLARALARVGLVVEARRDRHPVEEDAERDEPDGHDEGSERDAHDERDASALAAALRDHARTAGDVVLFVDQLEEAFAAEVAPERSAAFLRAVLGAATAADPRVRVLVSLREDFVSRVAATLGTPLTGVFVLPPPSPAGLVRALVAPAAARGFAWEPPELAAAMVAEVRDSSAAPALLQFAATQLWEARDVVRKVLGQPEYDRLGGAAGSLARHADDVLVALGDEGSETARLLFLCLLTEAGTRRIVSRERLLADVDRADAAIVLETLVAERLVALRSEGKTVDVEIVHESLVGAWARLRGWLDANREERALLRQAEDAARTWERRGCTGDLLWRGRDLADARDARAALETRERVPPLVGRFLDASTEVETRARRRRSRLFGATLIGLTLAFLGASAGAIAFRAERAAAERHRDEAIAARSRAEEKEADALREIARSALERGDYVLARERARASLALVDDPRTRAILHRASEDPLEWSRVLGGPALGADITPDGRLVAAGAGAELDILDGSNGSVVRRLRPHADTIVAVRFSPDGHTVASGGMDGVLALARADADAPIDRVVERGQGIYAIAWAPDGAWLAGGGRGGDIHVVDTARRASVRTLHASDATVNALAVDRAGQTLWSADNDGVVREWDVARGTVRRTLGPAAAPSGGGRVAGSAPGVQSLALAPDGAVLVAGDAGGNVVRWNLASGDRGAPVRAHRSIAHALAFARGSGDLVTGGHDHALRVFGQNDADGLVETHDEGSAVWDVRFARDDRFVVASGDRTVRVYEHARGRSFEHEGLGHTSSVDAVAFHPDGATIASGGYDRTVRLWSTHGEQRRVLRGHAARVWDVRFSPDGRLLASTSEDQTTRIWDAAIGTPIHVLSAEGGTVYGVAFVTTGATGATSDAVDAIATVSKDGRLRLWSLGSGAPLDGWPTGDATVVVAFLPRTRELVTAGAGGVHVWDLHGHLRAELPAPGSMRGLAVDARGRIASVTAAGSLVVWDRAARTRRVVGTIRGRVDELAFDAAGEMLLATSPEGRVVRVEVERGTTTATDAHPGATQAIAVDPRGASFVTGGEDGTVRLFRATDGSPVWGPRDAPAAAAVRTRDWIATPRADGSIEITAAPGAPGTNAATRAILSVAGSESEVTALSVRDGLVIAGHRSGVLRLWDATKGLLEEHQLHGAIVGLSLEEERLVARTLLGAPRVVDLRWLKREAREKESSLQPAR